MKIKEVLTQLEELKEQEKYITICFKNETVIMFSNYYIFDNHLYIMNEYEKYILANIPFKAFRSIESIY